MVCASWLGEKNPGDGVDKGATEGVEGGVVRDVDDAEGGATDCSCWVQTVRGCVTGCDWWEIGMAVAATSYNSSKKRQNVRIKSFDFCVGHESSQIKWKYTIKKMWLHAPLT